MAETRSLDQLKGKRTLNEVRDMIHYALRINQTQKLPILILSNPGLGKTTICKTYCKLQGYALVTLIGTQRTREDILGYQVNTGKRLETFTPDWFNEIHEYDEKGVPCMLFLDEISQAPEDVQGALLQVCFDRKIGGTRNFLPESTIIVAAANYKENLPPQCTLQAAMLNRFCIVNIDPSDGKAMCDEFLQDEDDLTKDLLVFEDVKITERMKSVCKENLKTMFTTLFNQYATKNGQNDVLSVHNQMFNDIFEKTGPVYNFISGRSMHYLYKLCIGIIESGLYHRRFAHRVQNMCLGLIGNGTNSFQNDNDLRDFRDNASLYFLKVIRKTTEADNLTTSKVTLDFSKQTVEEAINSFNLSVNGGEVTFDKNFENLLVKVSEKYSGNYKSMGALLGTLGTKDEQLQLVKDINAVNKLIQICDANEVDAVKNAVGSLKAIRESWLGYKCEIEKEVLGI